MRNKEIFMYSNKGSVEEMKDKSIRIPRTFRIREGLHSTLKVKAAQLGMDMADMVEAGIIMVVRMNKKEIESRLGDA